MHWISSVLGRLSECILAEDGVLVDYIGDEVMAMWGAPEDQPDHALRAVRAALAMLEVLPDLNARSQNELNESLDLGIGLNTGLARVGNVGTKIKFKYGPHGNTVNLASRVQGLTKYLKCRLLVTEATQRGLAQHLAIRRVCLARVVNIPDPVRVYEVAQADEKRQAFFRQSEEALQTLEKGDFLQAARLAGAVLHQHSGSDGPTLLVLSRATEPLLKGKAGFDPVWDPPCK
jgi:adenylate cyclase